MGDTPLKFLTQIRNCGRGWLVAVGFLGVRFLGRDYEDSSASTQRRTRIGHLVRYSARLSLRIGIFRVKRTGGQVLFSQGLPYLPLAVSVGRPCLADDYLYGRELIMVTREGPRELHGVAWQPRLSWFYIHLQVTLHHSDF